MSQDNLIRLVSESGHTRWSSRKKKMDSAGKYKPLELKKYDPKLRKMVTYKEKRKKS